MDAMIAGVIVIMVGANSAKWVIGAYLAAISPVLLNGLAYPELDLFLLGQVTRFF